jgi:hypothetical protein
VLQALGKAIDSGSVGTSFLSEFSASEVQKLVGHSNKQE